MAPKKKEDDKYRVLFQESLDVPKETSRDVYQRILAKLKSLKCDNENHRMSEFNERTTDEGDFTFVVVTSSPNDILFFRSYNNWCCFSYRNKVETEYRQLIMKEFPDRQNP